MNEAARRRLINERVEEASKGPHQQLQLPWQDAQQSFPVVRIPLSAVLLSPFSHRIKSQLQSHPNQEAVETDPFGDEGQAIIAEILRDSGRFEDLKKNLEEKGQAEPGVVTRNGVLVNANRRATALRDLGRQYLNVAVLPEGATHQEITELELSLQVREDFKEDYSFTNTLLFVKDLLDQGYGSERIALMLNLAASSDPKELKRGREQVHAQQRMLAMIGEVQNIAAETEGKRLPLTFFDGKRQILIETDDAYEKRRKTDPKQAELLKKTRLVGLLTDAGYGPVRQMDETFFSEYLLPALDEIANDDGFEGSLSPLITSGGNGDGEADPSLDLLGEDDRHDDVVADPARLLKLLAGSHGKDEVEVPSRSGDGTVRVPREVMLDHLTTAIKLAADEHKEEASLQRRVEAPMKNARSARRQLDRVGTKLDRVHDRPDFSWSRFDEEIDKLRRSYDALLRKIAKHRGAAGSPGSDGMTNATKV